MGSQGTPLHTGIVNRFAVVVITRGSRSRARIKQNPLFGSFVNITFRIDEPQESASFSSTEVALHLFVIVHANIDRRDLTHQWESRIRQELVEFRPILIGVVEGIPRLERDFLKESRADLEKKK